MNEYRKVYLTAWDAAYKAARSATMDYQTALRIADRRAETAVRATCPDKLGELHRWLEE